MKRLLFVAVLLVLLFGTFGTAFAQEPDATLGEVWWFFGTGFIPGSEVNMYLYRPPTVDEFGFAAWPFAGGPWYGTWYWSGGDSVDRRQSWPAWQTADAFGLYYAEFMLPRDEVWYPCSYPYKWNCNYVWYPGDPINPPVIEYHSPVNWWDFELGLVWPHYDAYTYWLTGDFDLARAVANPLDTVSPLTAKMLDEWGVGFFFDFEVIGYYWKWSDLEEPFYWVGW